MLGGTGFVGGHLVASLERAGHDVSAPGRDAPATAPLGHLIYAIGLTGDFRTRALDTIEAHVCVLRRVLAAGGFDSLLYLSTTRVYGDSSAASEDDPMLVRPTDPDHLYNLSKLTGESMCLAVEDPTVRVVRLSNVYGPGAATHSFLGNVLEQARGGRVTLGQDLASSKDYVSIDDVVEALPQIAMGGAARIYNVAGGRLVTHGQVLDALGCADVEVAEGAPVVAGPVVSIERAASELGYSPRSVLADLPGLAGR